MSISDVSALLIWLARVCALARLLHSVTRVARPAGITLADRAILTLATATMLRTGIVASTAIDSL